MDEKVARTNLIEYIICIYPIFTRERLEKCNNAQLNYLYLNALCYAPSLENEGVI